MYIQCKQGFVEADRWDGQKIPVSTHQRAAVRLRKASASSTTVVLRSREEATLVALLALLVPRVPHDPTKRGGSRLHTRRVYQSPAGWDYEWRAYVTAEEWGTILAQVALGLDYRNFKSWTTANKPADHRLAHDIWHVVHDDGRRKRGARW